MVSAKQTGRGSGFRVVLGLSAILIPGLAMAQAAPIDPYAPAPPPIVAPPPAPAPAPPAAQPAPPAPAPAPPPAPAAPGSVQNSGTINNNQNTNTVSPVITANPVNNNSNTSNNTNTNDNKSSATATNNNTIYIYPPAYPPPAPPPVVAPPTALSPPRLVPPPLVPGPAYGAPPPYYQPQRIRLNCRQLCATPPPPVLIPSPLRERIRYVSIGTHITALGMANQPLAGWGTLYGGGFQITMRSRGRFGFEMSQDFLRGELRASDGGNHITRNSFPIDFTFRGYILPNLDRYHFNMYFGAGFGAIASSLDIPAQFGVANQSFLEWTLHADLGAELRFKWIALGVDSKVMGIIRDRNFGDGAYYGSIQDGPVPAKTWGLQGRGYLSFWF